MRILPRTARNWINRRIFKASPLFQDRTTTPAQLMLWIEELPPPRAAGSPSSTTTWLALADESGVLAGARDPESLFWGSKVGVTHPFKIFPRRSERLQVRWFQGDYNEAKLVGTWIIPNPCLSSVPPWPAEPLPALRTSGDLKCRLQRVVFGVRNSIAFVSGPEGEHVKVDLAKTNQEPGAMMVASFIEDGRETNAWTIAGVSLSDATGNEITPGSSSLSSVNQTVCFGCSPVLWPSETWQVRIFAKRVAAKPRVPGVEMPFTPQELVVISNVPLPEMGGTLNLNEKGTNGAVTIHLSQCTLRPPREGGGWSTADASEIKATIAGLTTGVYVDLIEAIDEKGNIHYSAGWSSSETGGALSINYAFPKIPAGTRRLTLRFAVQQAREFKFRVRPEIAHGKVTLP